MATVFNEGLHTGEFIVCAEEGLAFTEVTIAANSPAMVPGTVVGKITSSGKWIPHAANATDGSQTNVGILYRAVPQLTVDQRAVVVTELAEVVRSLLTGLTPAAEASLAAMHVKFR